MFFEGTTLYMSSENTLIVFPLLSGKRCTLNKLKTNAFIICLHLDKKNVGQPSIGIISNAIPCSISSLTLCLLI